MRTLKRSYIREILDATNEDTISFAGGLPNEKLFPLKQIKKATKKVLKTSHALQYSKSIGNEALREKIAKIYTKKLDFPTKADEILITTGSQQAFDIISKTFVHKELFVQKPTYIGALGAFKILGKSLNDFDDIKTLKSELKEDDTLYLMSDFSNPTSKSMTKKQREEYALLLKQSNAYLVEDGAYSLLSFNGRVKKPISSFYENSFHLGSFSKIVAPGLRVGWIRTSKENIEKLLIAKESLDLHTSTLSQMIINQYLEDNDLFEHIKVIRKEYESKMNYMTSCMKKYLPSFIFEKPKGGMFIYGKFEVDSLKLAKKALEKNIAFVPSCVFDLKEENSTYARFNFTNSSKQQMRAGIKTISEILSKE